MRSKMLINLGIEKLGRGESIRIKNKTQRKRRKIECTKMMDMFVRKLRIPIKFTSS